MESYKESTSRCKGFATFSLWGLPWAGDCDFFTGLGYFLTNAVSCFALLCSVSGSLFPRKALKKGSSVSCGQLPGMRLRLLSILWSCESLHSGHILARQIGVTKRRFVRQRRGRRVTLIKVLTDPVGVEPPAPEIALVSLRRLSSNTAVAPRAAEILRLQ